MEFIEEEVKTYALVYEDVHSCGYAFPCDKHGAIIWEKVSSPTAVKKNLAYCKEHPEEWNGKNGEVVTLISRSHYGICPCCGRKVYFNGSGYFGAFKCDCGKWYNRFGQELKSPEDVKEDYDPFEDIEPYDEYELEQEAWKSHWHEEGF